MNTPENKVETSQSYQITGLVGISLDYSKDDNWMRLDRHPQHKVDLIYFYPTVAMTVGQNGGVLSENTEEVKKTAQSAYTITASAVGFPVLQEWLRQNPQIKFAEGEDDVGVLISWNTEGPNPTKKSYVQQDGAVVINPLNWKRDETPASVLENKGSLTSHNPQEVGPGIADATLNLKRGTVVCTTGTDYIPAEMHHFFGDQSLHAHDYDFYYANIKENGQKRIDAYFKKK